MLPNTEQTNYPDFPHKKNKLSLFDQTPPNHTTNTKAAALVRIHRHKKTGRSPFFYARRISR
jgi:hypothetical protein